MHDYIMSFDLFGSRWEWECTLTRGDNKNYYDFQHKKIKQKTRLVSRLCLSLSYECVSYYSMCCI